MALAGDASKLRRNPAGMQVNGAYLFVAEGTSEKFWRLGGMNSFTMPAETGTSNEVVTMDGNIAYAQAAGVGTITGALSGVNLATPAARILNRAKASGGDVKITILRLATGRVNAEIPYDTSVQTIVAANATKAGSLTASVFKAALPGKAIYIGANTDSGMGAASDSTGYVEFDTTAASGEDGKYRVITEVDTTSGAQAVHFSPGIATARVTASSKIVPVSVITPGIAFEELVGTVSQFDAGDFQAGQALASNFTFQPSDAVSEPTILVNVEFTTAQKTKYLNV